MTTTQNLHLPQWEADDRIMMDDFNDAMSKLDTAIAGGLQIISGSYDGDADATAIGYDGYQAQNIALPFRPRILVVTPSANSANDCLLLIDGMDAVCYNQQVLGQITSSGFTVGTAKEGMSAIRHPELNTLGKHYYYIAVN